MASASALQTYVSMITSVVAIAISSLTLGWTIYRDVIRKPKLKIDIAIKKIIQAGNSDQGPYVVVEALNMGPIPNRIGLPFVRKSWIKRRFLDREFAGGFVYPDYQHWATTPASTRLEVGDRATFIFPYDGDSFLKDDFFQIGISDGFGRIHWSSHKDFCKARERYLRDYSRQQA